MNTSTILRRMSKSRLFLIGFFGILFIVGTCMASTSFLAFDPLKSDLMQRLNAPEWFAKGLAGHIFGTDPLGRDVLSRLLIGGRSSLLISCTVVLISAVIGTTVGLVSGYFSGKVDSVLMRFCDMLMAVPSLILAICVVAVLGSNFFNLILTLCLASWVQTARIVRGNVLGIRDMEYIKAAKVMGSGHLRIILKEVLPNVLTPVLITATQRFGGTILVESSMSYLGMGVPVPTPSWGTMISDGRDYLASSPWIVVAPGIMLMLTVLCFNFLGDGLRDVFDPKNID